MTDGQVLVALVAAIGLWSWIAIAAGISIGRQEERDRTAPSTRRQMLRDLDSHRDVLDAYDRASRQDPA